MSSKWSAFWNGFCSLFVYTFPFFPKYDIDADSDFYIGFRRDRENLRQDWNKAIRKINETKNNTR